MKKPVFLIIVLIATAIFISCDKKFESVILLPQNSDAGITAIYNSGNLSCEELEGSYIGSTGRINYEYGEFESPWPDWLTVTVTGNKYIEFVVDPSSPFCIGAVIVKGGKGANVYYYDGVKYDAGLTSPINPSGKPADLSNLTFCYVECDNLVFAVKCFYTEAGATMHGISKGINYFSPAADGEWCADWFLGVNPYPLAAPVKLNQAGIYDSEIGEVSIVDGTVTFNLYEDRVLIYAYVYIGTLEGLINHNLSGNGCPVYTNSPPWTLIEY